MSGRSAMAVSLAGELDGIWDGPLGDACLAFADTLVRNAAAVIEGVKPAAIYSLPMRVFVGGRWRHLHQASLDEVLCAYGQALPDYGMQMKVLYRNERRVYLLVWRPAQLTRALDDAEGLSILREQGYEGSCAQELVQELCGRLVGYYRPLGDADGAFPHEIGVFLGYPAHDVRCFMEGEAPVCVGAWNAYGDERAAQQRFQLLRRHERRCRGRFAAGEPLHALFVA